VQRDTWVVSRENVELHRRFYDAFNVGDIEGMLALCHSEIEFYSRFVVVAGVTAFRGHVGMREWNRGFEEVWGDVRLAPEAYVDLGDRTLAFGTVQARGRQSGAEATMELFQALWWDEGLCTVLKSYGDRDEALAQLGVAEDELDRIDP
jgi:ketosteroid isomerase-like protein